MATITDPIMLDSTGQDIKDQISALNTKIQTLNTLLADLGLVSITPISQQDYDALSQAEKLAGVFDIYDAVEPDIDGNKVSYDSNTSVVEKINSLPSGVAYKDVTITTDASGLVQIGSDTIADSISRILSVNILHDDSHNQVYVTTSKRYSGDSTNTTLLFKRNSDDAKMVNTEMKIRIWYAVDYE